MKNIVHFLPATLSVAFLFVHFFYCYKELNGKRSISDVYAEFETFLIPKTFFLIIWNVIVSIQLIIGFLASLKALKQKNSKGHGGFISQIDPYCGLCLLNILWYYTLVKARFKISAILSVFICGYSFALAQATGKKLVRRTRGYEVVSHQTAVSGNLNMRWISIAILLSIFAIHSCLCGSVFSIILYYYLEFDWIAFPSLFVIVLGIEIIYAYEIMFITFTKRLIFHHLIYAVFGLEAIIQDVGGYKHYHFAACIPLIFSTVNSYFKLHEDLWLREEKLRFYLRQYKIIY